MQIYKYVVAKNMIIITYKQIFCHVKYVRVISSSLQLTMN
jgi:hypothetical protein